MPLTLFEHNAILHIIRDKKYRKEFQIIKPIIQIHGIRINFSGRHRPQPARDLYDFPDYLYTIIAIEKITFLSINKKKFHQLKIIEICGFTVFLITQ